MSAAAAGQDSELGGYNIGGNRLICPGLPGNSRSSNLTDSSQLFRFGEIFTFYKGEDKAPGICHGLSDGDCTYHSNFASYRGLAFAWFGLKLVLFLIAHTWLQKFRLPGSGNLTQ
ncbi:uncharacterized protein H6S33_013066 [Morchella sextelata]|uniref:uncharacterized protein n=1 Tax=Morchella sextelata TaxID=1174677 RepID=UPI001D03AEC5|nr:uncharacterized protein H6S33_013066 [Morchella sextelata]KAH0609580.1 hypothetical protein H6S33_013066 [Morchella sextelata]